MEQTKGIAYPLRNNPSGLFHNTSYSEQIKASLLTIIMTLPGERVMESDFGTPLHQLNFSQPKEIIEEQARQMIAASINKWEKRIQIGEVTTSLTPSNGSFDLFINIQFVDPTDLKTAHQLTLEIPVGGNNG